MENRHIYGKFGFKTIHFVFSTQDGRRRHFKMYMYGLPLFSSVSETILSHNFAMSLKKKVTNLLRRVNRLLRALKKKPENVRER